MEYTMAVDPHKSFRAAAYAADTNCRSMGTCGGKSPRRTPNYRQGRKPDRRGPDGKLIPGGDGPWWWDWDKSDIYAGVVNKVDPRYPGSGGGGSEWEWTDVLFPFGGPQIEMLFDRTEPLAFRDICYYDSRTNEWFPPGCNDKGGGASDFLGGPWLPAAPCGDVVNFWGPRRPDGLHWDSCGDYATIICRAFQLLSANRDLVQTWCLLTGRQGQLSRSFEAHLSGAKRVPLTCSGTPYLTGDFQIPDRTGETSEIHGETDSDWTLDGYLSCDVGGNLATGYPPRITVCRSFLADMTAAHAEADLFELTATMLGSTAGIAAAERRRLCIDLYVGAVILHEMYHFLNPAWQEKVAYSLETWFRVMVQRRYNLTADDGCCQSEFPPDGDWSDEGLSYGAVWPKATGLCVWRPSP